MRNIFVIILLGATVWYGYNFYQKHQAELQPDTSNAQAEQYFRCTTKDGRVIYGDPPQGVKCVKREPLKGSLTILPSQHPAPKAEQPSLSIVQKFHCDGRTHCSQMTSCEEAKYFLQHCPNVSMDGNADGIPCERQWCK